MPEFLSRAMEWFKARSRTQQILIGAAVLVVLIVASPLLAPLVWLIFFAALLALVVQFVRRRPVRPWAIAAGGALIFAVVFSGFSSALLGPSAEDQPRVEQAEKPEAEEEPDPPEEMVEEEPVQGEEEAAEPEVPEYSVEQTDNRTLGNGGIAVDLNLRTEATDAKGLRAIGEELKEVFRNEADGLYVEQNGNTVMWVFIEEGRMKDAYPEVADMPEYRDGILVYNE